jgi:hypothetical protein
MLKKITYILLAAVAAYVLCYGAAGCVEDPVVTVDTVTIRDTITDTIKETIRDTVTDTIKETIRDTIRDTVNVPPPPDPGSSPTFTGLPVIYINTQGGAPIVSKDDYLNAIFWMDGGDKTASVDTTVTTIKGRGNSTWGYPKKPYRLKFDDKISLFGLTSAKNWVLLANYLDPTFIMNSVAFEIGRRMSIPYTHYAYNVELILNGEHKGSYVLTEQVEVKKGRVDIDEEKDILVETDTYYDEVYRFRTPIIQLPVMMKSPESDAGLSMARTAFTDLEAAMFGTAFPNTSYTQLIDLPSVVDFILLNEIVRNCELKHPKSCYFYKQQGQKIMCGPLWDFDWAFGYTESGFNYFSNASDMQYYNRSDVGASDRVGRTFYCRFFLDPAFRALYKARWNEVRPLLANINTYIDGLAADLQQSAVYDYPMWGKNGKSFNSEIAKMKTWIATRINYLNTEINKY